MSDPPIGTRSIRDAVIQAQTGKSWSEWFAILDAWDMETKGQNTTARYLYDTYDISPWWSQAITIRYAWDRGLK